MLDTLKTQQTRSVKLLDLIAYRVVGSHVGLYLHSIYKEARGRVLTARELGGIGGGRRSSSLRWVTEGWTVENRVT